MPDVSFEGWKVDEETFLRVAGEAIQAVERKGVPYAFIGGVASALHGRPRWTHDVDLFVRRDDADRVLGPSPRTGSPCSRPTPSGSTRASRTGCWWT